MARLVGSTIEPVTLQPDIVQDGRVRLLVHWDAVQKEITDDMGTRTEWEYQEQVLWVPLPEPEYIEPGEYRPVLSAAGLAYLAANEEEILAWAQAGMTEAMLGELVAVIGMANETNRIANAYQIEVDERFKQVP